jgi:hypothetical protein
MDDGRTDGLIAGWMDGMSVSQQVDAWRGWINRKMDPRVDEQRDGLTDVDRCMHAFTDKRRGRWKDGRMNLLKDE